MIDLDVQVTGGHIGGKLAQDTEECGYALRAIFEEGGEELIRDLGEELQGQTDLVVWLRDLANAIEGAD